MYFFYIHRISIFLNNTQTIRAEAMCTWEYHRIDKQFRTYLTSVFFKIISKGWMNTNYFDNKNITHPLIVVKHYLYSVCLETVLKISSTFSFSDESNIVSLHVIFFVRRLHGVLSNKTCRNAFFFITCIRYCEL